MADRSPSRFLARWTGVALTLVGVAAIFALAATGQLGLYIHPRYHVFTVAMAVIGGAGALAAIALAPRTDADVHHDHHGHDHDHGHGHGHDQPTGPRGPWGASIRAAVITAAVVCLLVLPPASLTGTTLQKRDVASTARISSGTDVQRLVGADPLTFTVKDWAGLLAQGGPSSVLDRKVAFSAYLLDREDESVVYAARMLITCCAVDGQPVGVPLRLPDWQQTYQAGDWVSVRGAFVENPDPGSRFPVVVRVDAIEKVGEPEQPYVF